MTALKDSSFADYNGSYDQVPVNSTGLPAGAPAKLASFNVALVLDRTDPAAIAKVLGDNVNWATRQTTLAGYDSTTLWQAFGVNPTDYKNVKDQLQSNGIFSVQELAKLNKTTSGYVSDERSRTIWVNVIVDLTHSDQSKNVDQFSTLFGTQLYQTSDSTLEKPQYFW